MLKNFISLVIKVTKFICYIFFVLSCVVLASLWFSLWLLDPTSLNTTFEEYPVLRMTWDFSLIMGYLLIYNYLCAEYIHSKYKLILFSWVMIASFLINSSLHETAWVSCFVITTWFILDILLLISLLNITFFIYKKCITISQNVILYMSLYLWDVESIVFVGDVHKLICKWYFKCTTVTIFFTLLFLPLWLVCTEVCDPGILMALKFLKFFVYIIISIALSVLFFWLLNIPNFRSLRYFETLFQLSKIELKIIYLLVITCPVSCAFVITYSEFYDYFIYLPDDLKFFFTNTFWNWLINVYEIILIEFGGEDDVTYVLPTYFLNLQIFYQNVCLFAETKIYLLLYMLWPTTASIACTVYENIFVLFSWPNIIAVQSWLVNVYTPLFIYFFTEGYYFFTHILWFEFKYTSYAVYNFFTNIPWPNMWLEFSVKYNFISNKLLPSIKDVCIRLYDLFTNTFWPWAKMNAKIDYNIIICEWWPKVIRIFEEIFSPIYFDCKCFIKLIYDGTIFDFFYSTYKATIKIIRNWIFGK